MRFYSKSGNYFWDIDRFHLFTETEKAAMFTFLKEKYQIWKDIDEEKHGMAQMLYNLMNEVDKSLEQK